VVCQREILEVVFFSLSVREQHFRLRRSKTR
jgi:hypothetical protein